MNAVATAIDDDASARAVLRTLVVTDLVDSTALVESMGDRPAAELIRRHDRMVRSVADRHGGREIDKTDGFLLMFDRPIQAVAFALDYQRALRQLNAAEQTSLCARVGIHVGDVVVWENAPEDVAKGAKPIDVEGLVKPVASRLMSLALPGQILLSNIAYALAHRAQGELGVQLERVRWRTYGRYRFRGVPDPIPVFEVGEDGVAPLKAPPWSGKAHREIPFWRRPLILAAEAIALVAFVAIPAFVVFKPEPAIAFADRDWVIVGNLNNLTREPVFDETLQGALRIALEQSRYVNVLPDLKVRDTVKRMQRDPDATRIDRTIGSEIAIRDGAKALILPTVAEVGGRMRVTAEVIDPHTQTTVYSESADGVGTASVLPSLDLVNQRLRVRLGEALATVGQESLPLEKVATKNLDALRMFTRGRDAISTGDMEQGFAFYRQAIEMDADFALARMELADRLLTQQGGRREALEQIDLAMATPERLSARDRLLGDAIRHDFESPGDALSRWRVLAELYPDYFRGQGAYGFYAWHYANDYPAAIAATRRNAVDRNPRPGTGHYLLGTLLLGIEDYAAAQGSFEASAAAGLKPENHFHAALYAAQRRYDRAEAILAGGRKDSPQSFGSSMLRLSLSVDRGAWPAVAEAWRTRRDASSSAPAETFVHDDSVRALRSLMLEGDDLKSLVSEDDAGNAGSVDGNRADAEARAYDAHVLFRAWLAARNGEVDTARRWSAKASARARDAKYPMLAELRLLVSAELLRADGKPAEAVAMLRPALGENALLALRVAFMQALSDAGDPGAACEQARTIATRRGRAYTEIAGGLMFVPFNVAQSNLAVLALAECSVRRDDVAGATRALNDFLAIWPKDAAPAPIRSRIEDVERKLSAPATASLSR